MTSENNAKGIIIMVLSMAAFAVADTLVKVCAPFLSPAQTLFYLMGGGLVLFALLAIVQGEKLINSGALAPMLWVRYLAEIGGMVGMVSALVYVPLSTVGAITQATPILVAVGAALFLGEKVSWRRWSSIFAGFVGVLLIIRPGSEGFDYSVLWALLAVAAMSVRDLTTRMVPADIGSASLATYTMTAAIPFTSAWVLYNGESFFPPGVNWLIVLPMVSLGAVGYVLLITSIRMAPISVVTPFRYTRILFLIAMGMMIFDERPSATTLLGAAIIIASGVYIMWREQRVKKLAV